MEKISDKLHSIVVLLEKEDIKKLTTELKTHKNKKFEKLFKIMLDSLEKEISKETAFKKIYDKEYKKEDDFLIRNECRLLYNIIKEYLINKEIQLEKEEDINFSDYYFIKAIYQKKDKTLFNKEFNHIYDRSIASYDLVRAMQLCDLHYIATGAQQIQNFTNIKNAVEVLEKQQQILGELYSLKSHIINTRKLNMHAILSIKDREALNLEPSDKIEFDKDKYQNNLISYYSIVTQTLMENDISKKIVYMEEALKYIDQVADSNKDFENEKNYCQINVASFYYINQNYEKAEELFNQFYATDPKLTNFTLTSIINYGNCLLQLGKFSELLDILVKYKQELDANQRLSAYITALLCNVYVMTENADRLRKQIPISFQELPDPFVFHFRFCLCILYYLEGDYESAIRESRNLCDSIAYKKIFEDHLYIAKLFNKFFDKYDKRNAIDFKKYCQQLLNELNEYEKTCAYNFKIFIPSKWLRKKLAQYS